MPWGLELGGGDKEDGPPSWMVLVVKFVHGDCWEVP